MRKALIVYSGGLDTTVCIPLMREQGFDTLVTVTVDVGQPQEDVQVAAERAQQMGTEHHVVDAKDEFATDYCMPAIAANADYFGYPLSTAIARPSRRARRGSVSCRRNALPKALHNSPDDRPDSANTATSSATDGQ